MSPRDPIAELRAWLPHLDLRQCDQEALQGFVDRSTAIELPEDITPEARTRTERRRAQRIATLKEQ